MRYGLYIPLFEELADPTLVARLCAEAEEAGWHGVFVWDHVRWREPVVDVADPWITLAAIATATERIRLGPMVTPLARRRPAKVARETATVHYSRPSAANRAGCPSRLKAAHLA
jgi:alkanesulfonate monooxygenase SsuD/methylene tetrahydromethanopterin reductase-like flavin-dependent oxidoreductase (luciferase family)